MKSYELREINNKKEREMRRRGYFFITEYLSFLVKDILDS
jgi:hypothetical protein